MESYNDRSSCDMFWRELENPLAQDEGFMPETLVWFHIPKTAGTSLVAEIGRFNVPWAHLVGGLWSPDHGMVIGNARDFLREKRDDALRGVFRIMFGHMTQRDFLAAIGPHPDFRYATMLRAPVDRLQSEYRYVVSSPQQPDREFYAERYPTFDSFVDAQVDGNVMAHYLEEFRGEPVQRIVDRLIKHYAVVGLIESYEKALFELRARFGVQPSPPVRLNASLLAAEPASPATVAKVRERNARDFELYEAIVARRRAA